MFIHGYMMCLKRKELKHLKTKNTFQSIKRIYVCTVITLHLLCIVAPMGFPDEAMILDDDDDDELPMQR